MTPRTPPRRTRRRGGHEACDGAGLPRRGSPLGRALARGLALVAGLALAGCPGGREEPLEPPHGLVLIGLDTLRADGLSAYGNPRPTSPVLDALAERGVLFENAISNASWTLPGFVGILTGRPFSRESFRNRGLRGSLVKPLREAGYATAAFTEGGYVSSFFGMDQGFDVFEEDNYHVRKQAAVPESESLETFARAREWLEANASEPFFLFVHTYEPHTPYRRRRFVDGLDPGVLGEVYDLKTNVRVVDGRLAVGEAEREYVRALYDGGVEASDRAVGELLETLESLGIADRTVVAVTSDHGEALGERDPQELGKHGHALYDSVLHVPLILHDPRRRYPVQRVGFQVRTLDVLPTLLDLAGVAPPADVEGRSLVPLMRGSEREDRVAYSELMFRGRKKQDALVERSSLRVEGFKLIANDPSVDGPALELYELANDPDELVNLADERPRLRSRLYFQLLEQRSAIDDHGRPPVATEVRQPALREQLRALGYIRGDEP